MSITPSLQTIFIPLSNDARAPAPEQSSGQAQGIYRLASTPDRNLQKQPEADNRAATAKADGDLAVEVHKALLDRHNDKPLHISPHSTLGMWFEQFKQAVHSPAFKAWLESQQFDGGEVDFHTGNSSITWRPVDHAKQTQLNFRSSAHGVGIEVELHPSIEPADNEEESPFRALFKSLVKLVNSTNANQNKEIKLTGSEDQPAILGLVMAAATVIDSGMNRGLSAADADKTTLPLATVLAFYGVDRNDPDVIAALGRDKTFAPITSPRAVQSDKARGTRTLLNHQRLVGDTYDRQHLGNQLQVLIGRMDAGQLSEYTLQQSLEDTRMPLSPGSSYSQAHHSPAGSTVSLAQFIHATGRALPNTREALLDLQQQMSGSPDILLADAMLAEGYSRAVQQQPKPSMPPRIEVPAHSVMGAWLTLYRSHLEQPVVTQWMRDQGIDPSTVVITPATGVLSAKVKGQVKQFTLDDDSGWRPLASPLIAAAKVIAPGPEQQLARPVGNPGFTATPDQIGAFYGEGPNPDAARLATLKAQGGFDFPAPDTAAQLTSRSLKSLERHEHLATAHYEVQNKAAVAKARANREKERYLKLMLNTGQALPVLRNEAKKWAEKIILEQTGQTVDADKIFLNRFEGTATLAPTATGWEHTEQEPSSSLALPDALLKNFNEKDRVPGDLDLLSGLYTVGKGHGKEGYGAHNQFPLAPSKLMKAALNTDFQAQFTEQLERFWEDHNLDYRATLKGEFVNQARQQLKAYESATPEERQAIPMEHRLTRDDYRHILSAVAANLPLDETQPLNLDQLRAEAPVEASHASVHALVINGAISSDILRLNKLKGGQQILYIPGSQPAFLNFNSVAQMDQWIAEQGKDPEKRKQFASHFRLIDRQDNDSFWRDVGVFFGRSEKTGRGVDTALKNIGSGYWSNREHVVIDDENIKLRGDVFSALTDIAEERMTSDADVTIKSNSEITRDTWLNDMTAAAGLLAKFAPVGEPLVLAAAAGTGLAEFALGTEKAASGDTSTERQQGVSAAIDGAVNTLFSITGASERVAEDPFALPFETPPATTGLTRQPVKPTLPLRTETFADGTRALTTETPMSEHAYTLPRANGFDVIDDDRVYRYDPKTPGVMSDLQAADEYKELEQFEAYCPAPSSGRVKRGDSDTCFVRTVNEVQGELQQELQALEHVRLYPSAKRLLQRERFTVFERRLYKVNGEKLVSVARKDPVTYKSTIRGSVVNDKNFGFYDGTSNPFIDTETRVVKLGPISDLCNDSRDVRGVVVASPRKGSSTKYLVIEADVGEFYYATLDSLKHPDAVFLKCTPEKFDVALAKSYRNKLYTRQRPAGTAMDNKFVALPKLEDVYKDLEKAGYAKTDVDALKARCADMTAEQKREVAYQLQRRGATGKTVIALHPGEVRTLVKPANFNAFTLAQQNRFYAEQTLQAVHDDMQATGLGPGNLVRSAADRARADAANSVNNWLRETRNPNALISGNIVIKAGAGNCGEMAALARETIINSGGSAYDWYAGDSHVFTVVGGPPVKPKGSINFTEPQWADAWVVDPWAGIACPASEYTQKLQQIMSKWAADGWVIRIGTDQAMSPTNQKWLDALIREPKEPYSHGYKAEPKPKAAAVPVVPVPRPLPPAETINV
ncbi:hypothetical protein LVW35_13850 [Pseudomonas sp. HN11]|uniref:dermonecrotic toxin domain-containing protein n=1 Tax=Pseudomonas sp. HN11 TaxID=1344094 RepID=UPI001F22BDB5|nr:DUF6543 domain-containing protein [Pseudomonas sp. HN11]UII74190.1 hypothetical protein LVW35_13850 [Pseudomonas sp. HN11]